MISLHDLYNVLSAVVPLYVAMVLAYGSVKWWKVFTREQCSGINRFVALFAVPLLSFHFIASNDPYAMNLRFLAADAAGKLAVLAAVAGWARWSRRGSLDWTITAFSLATLPNTLVMGIPLLRAMYGGFSGDLMVQIVVSQCIVWYTLLLVLFEYRGARSLIAEALPDAAPAIVSFKVDADVASLDGRQALQTEAEVRGDGKVHVTIRKSTSSSARPSYVGAAIAMGSTPRPSNMTGADIYSIPSSRNPTPRASNFNHHDFYSMLAAATAAAAASGGGSALAPRVSNFAPSDHPLLFSSGPTPRTSNFGHIPGGGGGGGGGGGDHDPPYFPTAAAAPSPAYRRSTDRQLLQLPPAAAHHFVDNPLAYILPKSPLQPPPSCNPPENGLPSSTCPGFSPTNNKQLPSASMPVITADRTPPPPPPPPSKKGDAISDAAKDLHMFVWSSSSASPVSEPPLAAAHLPPAPAAARNESTIDEPLHASNANAHLAHSHLTNGLGASRDPFEDYAADSFSFGNRFMSQYGGHDSGDQHIESMNGGTPAKFPHNPATIDLASKLRRQPVAMPPTRVMTKLILIMVWRKLLRNPNTYSSLLGLTWSLISSRWGIAMPAIVAKSISILSDAGLGMAMFSLGLFMALQPKIIACGNSIALLGMVIRFLIGPAVMAAASIAIGIRGVLLRVAVIQAALPQGIVPFVFAKEYNNHPDILSTGVIFGMLIALPITILYYFLLGL